MEKILTKATTLLFSAVLITTLQIAAQPVVGFQLKTSGLSNPLDVVNAGDGSGRIFVVQQAGTIRVYSSTYTLLNANFLTVSPINSGGEEGLLSLAFHPDYETNGFLFVYYTNNAGDLELARYQNDVPSDNSVSAATKQVVLTIDHDGQSNHNGGKLWFGTDGFLYFATGDGGGAGDPDNSAQTGNNLLGKMLRINVGTGVTASYSIPASNPFLTATGDPANTIMDEIYSLGLRNPFRWSFDGAGNMWIGDVGQGAWEEISRVTSGSGVNFGWRCYEGNHNYNNPPGCIVIGTHTPPIYEYPNPGAFSAAVTGGMVYEGDDYPTLQGWYYAADFYSGDIHMINTTTFASSIQEDVLTQITAFGETEDGELLVVTLGDELLQLLPASALPVKLEYFNGRKQNNNSVLLEWKTLSELNASYFEIEHSTDGSSYRVIGTVQALNVPTGSMYSFNHQTSINDRNAFYRLRMVDIDRSFEYSSIVRVVLKAMNNFVQPSLITNGMIDAYLADPVDQLRLVNLQGAIVKTVSLKGRLGHIQIQVSGVSRGAYMVQLISGTEVRTQKIIID